MTAAATGHVLVVGYGNPLCGDDGAGPAVVDRLAADPRLAGAELRSAHQLAPELARDIAAASLVVLVDAGTGPAPGEVVVATVMPDRDATAAAWSHHVEPSRLLALSRELYGAPPPLYTVCVGAASMAVGDGLSPVVADAIPAAADAVAAVVEGHRHA